MDQAARFERFESSYLESYVTLFIEVFNGPPWNDQWTRERATRWLQCLGTEENFRGFCGFDGDRLIAVVLGRLKMWWRGEEYHIEGMFVCPAVQGKGVGSRLLDFVEEELKKEKVAAITLATDRDVPAREFYTKNKFHCADNLIFMKKKL